MRTHTAILGARVASEKVENCGRETRILEDLKPDLLINLCVKTVKWLLLKGKLWIQDRSEY